MDEVMRAALDAVDAARKAMAGMRNGRDWKLNTACHEMMRGTARFVRRYAELTARTPGDFDERLNGRSFIELEDTDESEEGQETAPDGAESRGAGEG